MAVVAEGSRCARLVLRVLIHHLTQILVVRPAEKKVIVCNLYEFRVNGDQKQNIVAMNDDVIVATRRYPLEHQSCAREWKPIADYFAGRLDRAGLINAINNLPPPAWRDKE